MESACLDRDLRQGQFPIPRCFFEDAGVPFVWGLTNTSLAYVAVPRSNTGVDPATGPTACAQERQRQSPVVESKEMYKLVITLLCVLLAVASAQKAAQQPHQAEKKKSPSLKDPGPNGQRLGLASAPMRHRYHYDAMHINGKPFVTCNHPAFKFGCAHMTYPRTFMNQHHKLIMGAHQA